MNAEHQIANVLWSFGAAMVLLWLYFGAYAEYRLNRTRHNLFRLRAQLFDLGASGRIAFDGEAYGMLRTMLNRGIRYAHRTTLLDTVLCGWALKRTGDLDERRREHVGLWQSALGALDAGTRRELERIRAGYQRAVIEQLFISNPVIWVIATPLVAVLMVVRLWAYATRHFYDVVLPKYGSNIDVIAAADEDELAAAAA